MKLMLGNTPVKKMMIHNDTQDATMVASDLQAGVTCYAKGQKVTGTGKCFSFAVYGSFPTNRAIPIPETINVILIGSTDYFVKMAHYVSDLTAMDFSSPVVVATITIDGTDYPISVSVVSNLLTVSCSKAINLEIFYGKDNYL